MMMLMTERIGIERFSYIHKLLDLALLEASLELAILGLGKSRQNREKNPDD